MRIVIDLQSVQASNRQRGIGRYSLSLVDAIIKNNKKHEIFLVLNGVFTETIEELKRHFLGRVLEENIRIWRAPAPVFYADQNNTSRRKAAELIREYFISSLAPDFVLITSLFEGFIDNSVTSIGLLDQSVPTAVVLYDLIPMIHPSPYLDNPTMKAWYSNKIDHLRRADLTLAISESSRCESIDYIGFSENESVCISSAIDSNFLKVNLSAELINKLKNKYHIIKDFVMYTGGIDYRKNIEGLIRAYSMLNMTLRQSHQLVIVCAIHEKDLKRLQCLCEDMQLEPHEVIFTGYVPEEDLLALYNVCKLFVFPSWHEGFGLPVLEAMACGRAVIAANSSSLPEVIGREDILFDPYSDSSISQAIERILSDNNLRSELENYGLSQSKKFSWDLVASNTLRAIENRYLELRNHFNQQILAKSRPLLAYVSPLPPERTGIGFYSAELLLELSRYYDIQVITPQPIVSEITITEQFPIRSVEWFRSHYKHFDRVIYHFGNSSFHEHMFSLIENIPGIVVLHDFFLSGIVQHMDIHGGHTGNWARALYQSHGYYALKQRYSNEDLAQVVWEFPANLPVIQASMGLIVHSETSRKMAKYWYGPSAASDWYVIPLARVPIHKVDRLSARANLGISENAFVVCSFGVMGPSKLNHRLLDAWLKSKLSKSSECHLIFVGENNAGEYSEMLETRVKQLGINARIKITGWTDPRTFNDYLSAADVGVQLRTLSRGESSAAVLDCMNYGLATIVNANGSMADLPDNSVWKLPDEFDQQDLIQAIEILWQDETLRNSFIKNGRNHILRQHRPRSCAAQYYEAIESIYLKNLNQIRLKEIVQDLSSHDYSGSLKDYSHNLQHYLLKKEYPHRLFVDISELVQRDAKSGIQRVVRSIMQHWLLNPPQGFRVEPVYAKQDHDGYYYAREFTQSFLNCPPSGLLDEPIICSYGDIFIALDYQPHVQSAQKGFLQKIRHEGCKVFFVVYDLLCVQMPEYFGAGAAQSFSNWLEVVAQADGAICISQAVADDLVAGLDVFAPKGDLHLPVSWFHLGADVKSSCPTIGMPDDSDNVLKRLKNTITFLVVGTIEPRKMHAQCLEAFEILWQGNEDVNLVFVGKQGWMVESLVERLNHHPELGRRLFWLNGISDEYLEKIYESSDCLIAASMGEGFGLPLIEAGSRGMPILARDIPVFREVADKQTVFFTGEKGSDLAETISFWVKAYVLMRAFKWIKAFNKNEKLAQSNYPAQLTWQQSANQLIEAINGKRPYREWKADKTLRFWGNDLRLQTAFGQVKATSIRTTATSGILFWGPYISLPAGEYKVRIHGEVGSNGIAGAWFDVVSDFSQVEYAKGALCKINESSLFVEATFKLEKLTNSMEVRVGVTSASDLSIDLIEIEPCLSKSSLINAQSSSNEIGEAINLSEGLVEVNHEQTNKIMSVSTKTKREIVNSIHDLVLLGIEKGLINNRQDLQKFLNENGLRVSKFTKQSIFIIHPNYEGVIRMTGKVYEQNFSEVNVIA